jgi:hypothetical protein
MAQREPNATLPDVDPCLVLAANVHGIAFVHEVRAALTMANQCRDECRTAVAHLIKGNEHRVAAGKGSGRLAYHGEELRDEFGQRCVVLGQSEDLVRQPGRRAVHPGVQAGWSLGNLDVFVKVSGQLEQSVGNPLDPTDLPAWHRSRKCLFERVDRLEQLGPTAAHFSDVLSFALDLRLCLSAAICCGHTCSL